MKWFILEDDPNRMAGFLAAVEVNDVDTGRWCEEAREHFRAPYDVILLDHDLGGQQMVDSEAEDTGYQFVKWLTAIHPEMAGACLCIVHSWNEPGAQRMMHHLREAGWAAIRQPYGPTLLRMLPRLRKEEVCENGD